VRKKLLVLLLCLGTCTASINAMAQAWHNPLVKKRVDGKKITFNPTALKKGVKADFKNAEKSLKLGKSLFTAKNKRDFLKSVHEIAPDLGDDNRIQIGWVVPKELRYLGMRFGRTIAEIKVMSEKAFDNYRKNWTIKGELDHWRFTPNLVEAGGGRTQDGFVNGKLLAHAATQKELFDNLPKSKSKNTTSLFISFSQKCDMYKAKRHPHSYGLPLSDISILSPKGFQRWQKHFFQWIELHNPGQSNVKLFARLSDEDFTRRLAQVRDSKGLGHGLMVYSMRGFAKQTGLGLAKPNYTNKNIQPKLEKVTKNSTADNAGLKPGMTIIKVEDISVPEWDDFIFAFAGFQPGSMIKLEILNHGANVTEKKFLTIPPLFLSGAAHAK